MTVIYDFLGEKTERTAFHHKKIANTIAHKFRNFMVNKLHSGLFSVVPAGHSDFYLHTQLLKSVKGGQKITHRLQIVKSGYDYTALSA